MIKMSRAGRKAYISKVLYQQFKRNGDVMLRVQDIAHRMGMKSSTELKKMCRELIYEDDNIVWTVVNGEVRYAWRPTKQLALPERYIIINGKQHKVANWVADAKEFENA